MKKKYLFTAVALALVLCLSVTACSENGGNEGGSKDPQGSGPQTEENGAISAAELVAKITIGWNLGNTLDAHPGDETTWGNSKTTKAMITAIKDSGFNTIRIPVSWYKKAPKPNYTIEKAWMDRVKEVVGYAVDNDMYIILNTHHDETIFKFMDKDMAESKKAFKAIWEQIAEAFKDYDYNLIFEGLNEPRTKDSAKEWSGGTDEEHKNLNDMHQLFVDTVRASGGNNTKRVLMISTYAASVEAAAVNGLKLPTDTAENSGVNRFIVSTHSYSPYGFALAEKTTDSQYTTTWSKNNSSDTSPITTWINRVDTAFLKKGYPVIGGEFGALNKNNEDARAEWAEFYVSEAGKKGIKCVLWDDGGNFKVFDRSSRKFTYPKIYQGLMKGAGVTN